MIADAWTPPSTISQFQMRILVVITLLFIGTACSTQTPTLTSINDEVRATVGASGSTEELASNSVGAAIRIAQHGCDGIDVKLVGTPHRVLVSLSNSVIANDLLNSGTRLHNTPAPGSANPDSIQLVVVEGDSASAESGESTGFRSFIFAESVGDPNYSTCLISEDPIETEFGNMGYGFDEFELFETRN